MAKIYDVAKKAGVSIGTVSRVFNNYSDISEKTKKKVYEVAADLGYVPNVAARMLSSNKLQTIALILNNMTTSRFDDITRQILLGVYQYTVEHEMQFVFYPTSTLLQHQKTFDQFCLERNITGTVVQGLNVDDPYIDQIANSSIPVVSIDLKIQGEHTASISINNVQAEKEVTNSLISHGKRNLVMINGSKKAQISRLREQGFREAITTAGMTLAPYQVQYADFSIVRAREITITLLKKCPSIDGFVCANDAMAIGVMEVLLQLGFKAPADIEVVGFDNTIVTEYTTPTISSIDQHMSDIGTEAAHLVNRLISNDLPKSERTKFSGYSYIQRQSTGHN